MGSISLRHSQRRHAETRETRWALVVIQRPSNWEPNSWDDEPLFPNGLWTERRNLSLDRARSLMFGFNSASMEDHGRIWAILQPDLGRTVGQIGIIPTRKRF